MRDKKYEEEKSTLMKMGSSVVKRFGFENPMTLYFYYLIDLFCENYYLKNNPYNFTMVKEIYYVIMKSTDLMYNDFYDMYD